MLVRSNGAVTYPLANSTDDLAQATNIARTMVTRYGMDKSLGQVAYDSERQALLGPAVDLGIASPRSYSERTAWQIDEAVRELIHLAFEQASEILRQHRSLLDETAQELLEKETLTADQLPAADLLRGATSGR